MNTMNTSTVRAVAFLIFAVAVVAGGYFYQNTRPSALAAVPNTSGATTTDQFSMIAPGQNTTSGTTNIIPIDGDVQAFYKQPTYPQAITFSAKLSDSDKKSIQGAYGLAVADLAKDKRDFNAWISLGTINLMAGNYKTAETIWQYASAQWPANQVSHNNLGDLYMNYLKDYPKAEKEFLAAINNKGNDPNPYKNLFTLYSDTSYKPSNTAAEDILKRGIIAVPTAVDLKYMLAVYYRKLGRPQEAQAQFQLAIDAANQQGLTDVAKQIKIDAAR